MQANTKQTIDYNYIASYNVCVQIHYQQPILFRWFHNNHAVISLCFIADVHMQPSIKYNNYIFEAIKPDLRILNKDVIQKKGGLITDRHMHMWRVNSWSSLQQLAPLDTGQCCRWQTDHPPCFCSKVFAFHAIT